MNTDQKSLNGILIAMSEYYTGSQKGAIAAISAIYDGGMMIVDQQPHAAKVSWAIEILRSHNQWRRGSDTVEMANPTDLGNAIEIAIGVMDRANREILKEGDILSPPLAAPVVPDGWRLTEKQQIVWDWAASHGLTLLADDCNDLLWKLLLVEEK